MITLEALNALAGDCLLLRYPGPAPAKKEQLWIIDGGPKADRVKDITVWSDVLLPRLEDIRVERNADKPLPVALGMVSHIDDDHINGIQKLTNELIAARPFPEIVRFDLFWFNSFDLLVGPKPAGLVGEAAEASLQSLVDPANIPDVDDEHATAIMQSVPQGIALATDLRTLDLHGNAPVQGGFVAAHKGQQTYDIQGAKVTIVGPLQNRLDALRKDWAKALSKPTKPARQAALQELFLPRGQQDKAVANLSSIVVLVEIDGRKLLLTGDAHGDDVVTAWGELDLGAGPVEIDLLKLPHHGSIRNCTEKFITFFKANHYVFSGDGKHGNPDPQTVEATVKFHGERAITLHFTNEDVTWEKSYKLEKDGTKVGNLVDLLTALRAAYGGPWKKNFRPDDKHSVIVKLA